MFCYRSQLVVLLGDGMRVAVILALLTIFVSLVGCARKPDVTYVDLPPVAPIAHSAEPDPASKATRVLARNDGSSGAARNEWNTRGANNGASESVFKFAAVQAKAQQLGVEHLTRADIDGLSFDQIQQLRGY